MLPCLAIPRSVTVLYIFAVVNLAVMLNLTLVDADVIVLNKMNATLDDLPAEFGDPIPEEGILGRVLLAHPHNACHIIQPPEKKNSTIKWIALIRRKDCDFDVKVLNAQKAGFDAAIVHNIGSDKLVTMHGGKYAKEVKIPSVFIGEADGFWLEKLLQEHEIFSVIIDDHVPLNANFYLLPFAIVVGICFVVMVVFMIVKWILNIRRKRRSRLSKANLKKIPIKKFKKGDPYDVCAICLDEYEEDEKLRVLPCSHAYHQKCVDPWLTKNKRTCPLCKKKVIPGDPDSSSEEESDEDTGTVDSETTPLLASNNNSRGRPRGGNTFENSGLPSVVREDVHPFPGSDSDSSSYNDDDAEVAGTSASIQQSSVEVHETPRLHRQNLPHGNYGLFAPSPNEETQEKISVGSQTSGNIDEWLKQQAAKAESESESEGSLCQDNPGNQLQAEGEELQGAVGGVANLAFKIVEDHFNVDSACKKKHRKKRQPSPKEEIEVRLVTGGSGNIQESDEEDRLPPV